MAAADQPADQSVGRILIQGYNFVWRHQTDVKVTLGGETLPIIGTPLSFVVEFQPTCFAVTSATLNCSTLGMTVQTALTQVLHTCGVTSEPPWSPLIPQ